jgi:hypothetical protein
MMEDLEQLKILENGYRMKVGGGCQRLCSGHRSMLLKAAAARTASKLSKPLCMRSRGPALLTALKTCTSPLSRCC